MFVTCVVMTVCYVAYLEDTVDHTNDVVELLVVHYGAVLLDMKTQFLCQTLTSCLAFQCAQCSWQRLSGRRETEEVLLNKVTD